MGSPPGETLEYATPTPAPKQPRAGSILIAACVAAFAAGAAAVLALQLAIDDGSLLPFALVEGPIGAVFFFVSRPMLTNRSLAFTCFVLVPPLLFAAYTAAIIMTRRRWLVMIGIMIVHLASAAVTYHFAQ
jgi:hypothetical protein